MLQSCITENEIRQLYCISHENEKLPGYDGLPIEYYKGYVDIIAQVLLKVCQEIWLKGLLPPIFNNALISLVPKEDMDMDPANVKPIRSIWIARS